MDNTLNQPGQTVYLALGSNLGDRPHHMQCALQALNSAVTIQAISSMYETEPVGYLAQSRFLNLVCAGTTSLSPQDLLRFVKEIERTLGRVHTFRNGPRTIDIDILLYDGLQMHEEALTLPHPRMRERGFVLIPLAEIAPELILPGQTEPVSVLTARLPPQERANVCRYRANTEVPPPEKPM